MLAVPHPRAHILWMIVGVSHWTRTLLYCQSRSCQHVWFLMLPQHVLSVPTWWSWRTTEAWWCQGLSAQPQRRGPQDSRDSITSSPSSASGSTTMLATFPLLARQHLVGVFYHFLQFYMFHSCIQLCVSEREFKNVRNLLCNVCHLCISMISGEWSCSLH